MKKVLVITSTIGKPSADGLSRLQYVEEFCKNVNSKLDQDIVTFTNYSDIEITVIDGKVHIIDRRNNLDLGQDVKFVHFKNWVYNIPFANCIAYYLHYNGILFANSEVSYVQARSKITQMVILALNGLPVPDTVFGARDKLVSILSKRQLPDSIKLPFILKDDLGGKGKNNYLIEDPQQAIDILSNENSGLDFVIQKYHPNDGDLRLLYVGLDSQPMIFLRKSNRQSHLNNTSQGGSGEILDISTLDKKILSISRRAADLLGREISGVDVLVDRDTESTYILEVNQTPALATGFAVDLKVDKFAEFVGRLDSGL